MSRHEKENIERTYTSSHRERNRDFAELWIFTAARIIGLGEKPD